MYTILWYLLSTLCHRAVLQYVLPLRELPQCSFIQEDLMKITLFKILHAVCICIVMSTQLNLPFWTPLRINSFLLRTLPITNTFYYRHLSDRGASLLRTPLLFGHLFITDTSLLQRLFITDIPLVWTSLYGHLCYVKTSLLRNLLWKPLYHGHLSVSTANTH